MGPFKKTGKFTKFSSGRREESPRGRFDKRDSDRKDGPLEFHEATCAKCGKTCEVPFKPSGKKPIYCRDCFKKGEVSDSRDSYAPRRSADRYEPRGRSSESDGRPAPTSGELDKINKKLDRIMKALGIE